MSELNIRDATAEDLPALVALLADDEKGRFREDAGGALDPGYIEAFAAIAADPNQRLLVAVQDDRIVGTFQLSFLPGLSFKGAWRGQIEAVRVAGDLRGQGWVAAAKWAGEGRGWRRVAPGRLIGALDDDLQHVHCRELYKNTCRMSTR